MRVKKQLPISRQISIAEGLKESFLQRNPGYTESVAAESEQYHEQVKEKLKIRQPGRRLMEIGGETCLRKPTFPLYRVFEA